MSDYARKPDVAATEPFEIFKCIGIDVREFSGAVFGETAVSNRIFSVISPQAWEHLVYDRFACLHLSVCNLVSVI